MVNEDKESKYWKITKTKLRWNWHNGNGQMV